MISRQHNHKDRLSDNELIEQYKQSKDLQVAAELYQRYIPLLSVLCLKYLKDQTEAEDAQMEIFEVLVTDLLHHEINNFKAWLYSVTKNHCFKKLRKAKQVREKEEVLKIETGGVESEDPLALNSKAIQEQHLEQLELAMNQLGEEQKQCIELFYLQEKSYKEVADLTGFSMNQVKSYIQNGKRNIKLQMTRDNAGQGFT